MGNHFREQESFVCIVELTPTMRRRIEATIEHLVAILDQFDGDENLEDDAGGESYLGWTINGPDSGRCDFQDGELDESDKEPTLGWTNDGYVGLTHEEDEREVCFYEAKHPAHFVRGGFYNT